MKRDDIIRMAREAGYCHAEASDLDFKRLSRFAVLVAAAEREECTKEISAEINDEIEDEAYCILVALLARIRARGEHG